MRGYAFSFEKNCSLSELLFRVEGYILFLFERLRLTLIFLIIAFFLLSSSVFADSFPDVPKDHKNYKAIEYLDEKQVIKGYEDGTFKADNLVNRAEALKMIVEALKIKHDGDYQVLFPDVKKEEWYFSYVTTAKELGIVNGYQDGLFRPADTVNLAETLKMLLLAAKVDLPKEVKENVFADSPKEAWFAAYMLYGRDHNLILADDYGYIHPDQAMTRAAFAEIVYRMMVVLENKGQAFALHTNWDFYEGKNLPFKMKYDSHNWRLIENKNEVIFFRPDKQFSQFSATRIYQNSSVVRVTLDKNEAQMVEEQYFANIKAAFSGANYKKFNFNNLNALEVSYQRMIDWYIYLESAEVLVIYTEYGAGGLGGQLQQFIKAMLATLEYKEVSGEDFSELLSQIFVKILVEGKGKEALELLPDKLIIETDALGVGTGPVDYYYSEKLNYTFKYERASDVILDKREGRTTAF